MLAIARYVHDSDHQRSGWILDHCRLGPELAVTDKAGLSPIIYDSYFFGNNRVGGPAQLLDALQWCLELGVQCVTVYAFSIENFRRSEQEVATLMELAETKLLELADVIVHARSVTLQCCGENMFL